MDLCEGFISCLFAFISFAFVVVDQPWNFLSNQERDFVLCRVDRDLGDDITEAFSFNTFLKPATDFKVWNG